MRKLCSYRRYMKKILANRESYLSECMPPCVAPINFVSGWSTVDFAIIHEH